MLVHVVYRSSRDVPFSLVHPTHKADDDTYVMLANLREMLSRLDPDVPHYLGSFARTTCRSIARS